MGRVKPLAELKDDIECKDTIKKRDAIGRRIAWIKDGTIDHSAIISASIDVIREREGEESTEAKKKINALINFGEMIKDEKYIDRLMGAFGAYSAQVKQYEYSQEKKPLLTVIRQAVSGELRLGEYFEKINFVKRINRYGLLSTPGEIDSQDSGDALKEVIEQSNLVNIKLEPLSLIPVSEVNSSSKRREAVINRINETVANAYNEVINATSSNKKSSEKSNSVDAKRSVDHRDERSNTGSVNPEIERWDE